MSNCLLETMRPIVPFTREVKVAGEGQAEQEIKTRVGTKSTKMQLLLAAQDDLSRHLHSRAIAKYMMAASLGSARACATLGNIYYRGLKSRYPANPPAMIPSRSLFDVYWTPTAPSPVVEIDIKVDGLKSATWYLRGLQIELAKPFRSARRREDRRQSVDNENVEEAQNGSIEDYQRRSLELLHDLVTGLAAGYIFGAVRQADATVDLTASIWSEGVVACERTLNLPILASSSSNIDDTSPNRSRRRSISPSSFASSSSASLRSSSPSPQNSPSFRVRPLLLPALRDASPRHRSSPASPLTPTFPSFPTPLSSPNDKLRCSIRVHLHYIIALHEYSIDKSTLHWRKIIELSRIVGGIGTSEGDMIVEKAKKRLEKIAVKEKSRRATGASTLSSESGYYSDSTSVLLSPALPDVFSTCSSPTTDSSHDDILTTIPPQLIPFHSTTMIPIRSFRRTHSKPAPPPSLPPPRILRRVKSSASITVTSSSSSPDFIPPPLPRRSVSYNIGTDGSTSIPVATAIPPSSTTTHIPASAPVESWTRSLRRRASAFALSTPFSTFAAESTSIPPVPALPLDSATSILSRVLAKDDETVGGIIYWDQEERENDAVEFESSSITPNLINGLNQSSIQRDKIDFIVAPPKLKKQRSFVDPTRLSPRIVRTPATPTKSRSRQLRQHEAVPVIDPIFAVLESNSKLSSLSQCVICHVERKNLSSCPKCKRVYCSRKCRVSEEGGSNGHRHYCVNFSI